MQTTTNVKNYALPAYAVFSYKNGDFARFMIANRQNMMDYHPADYNWLVLSERQRIRLLSLTDQDGHINATAKYAGFGKFRIYSY